MSVQTEAEPTVLSGVQFASTERLGGTCTSCGQPVQRMRSSSREGQSIAFTAHTSVPATPHAPQSLHADSHQNRGNGIVQRRRGLYGME